MVSDKQLFYEHFAMGASYTHLASAYMQPQKDIRSRIARMKDIKTSVDTLRAIAERKPLDNEYLIKQKELVDNCWVAWDNYLASLPDDDYIYTFFISDIHYPYANWKALELVFEMVAHIQPHIITTYNDLFDMTGYGRWEDNRSPAARLWTDNIQNAIDLANVHHRTLQKLSKRAKLVEVTGNHDIWVYNYLRNNRNGFSEKNIYEFMQEMHKQGVLLTSYQGNMSMITLWDSVVLLHGQSSASSISSIADYNRKITTKNGKLYHTVSGHTHRIGVNHKYDRLHVNSGCLMQFDDYDAVPYLRYPPQWQTGFVIIKTLGKNPCEWVDIQPINIVTLPNGRLHAHYQGNSYYV
jgi:predicted phosphodiesterase